MHRRNFLWQITFGTGVCIDICLHPSLPIWSAPRSEGSVANLQKQNN